MKKALNGIDPADQDQAELHRHVFSRATYMSNILFRGNLRSSFELIRGYTPLMAGPPQSPITEEIIRAHQEQSSRRALLSVDSARSPHTLNKAQMQRDTPVFFFRRVPKPKWIQAWVRSTEYHIVLLSTRNDHAGKPVRAAYEDVRLVLETPLLQELDECDPLFPNSSEILDIPVAEGNLRS